MRDLKPNGTKIELGGETHSILFTLNAIDEIQEKCNMPLADAMERTVDAYEGKLDHETLTAFRALLAGLLSAEEDAVEVTPEEAGRLLHIGNYRWIAAEVLRAYGLTVPDPDENDEEGEEESPNVQTGQ